VKKRHLILGVAALIIPLVASFVGAETFGYKKRRPKPNEFGNVVINNFLEKGNIAPVVFKHWLHRAKFTCRLCHVDIGFAMRAQETKGTEKDNEMGLYCGACHNGKVAFGPKDDKGKNCDKCHSYGKEVAFKNDFYKFKSNMPKERFGNGIDWLTAEEKKLVKLQDYLEGVSIKRKKLQEQKEVDIKTKVASMPDIIFSHTKHAKWSGCELCHPEVFSVKKGSQPYSMEDIFNGKYCGLCHDLVAFPNLDCQRCHTKEV
jgi:c(7)-type cytochrome triheme protein